MKTLSAMINISRVPAVDWVATKSIETKRWLAVITITTRPIRVLTAVTNPGFFFKINSDGEVT